jgi:type VI protein secretion system component VasK
VSEPRPAVAILLPVALLAGALLALGVARWWVSGLAAPVVAALLWRRHPRARFAAYIFFSVVLLRGLAAGAWAAVLFAAAAVALMQTAAARRAWARLGPGRTRAK